MTLDAALIRKLASKVGTPFWLYDAKTIRQRIADIKFMTGSAAHPAALCHEVLPGHTGCCRRWRSRNIWIDA
jgi:diaminopimelate decarboxylase